MLANQKRTVDFMIENVQKKANKDRQMCDQRAIKLMDYIKKNDETNATFEQFSKDELEKLHENP